MNTMDLLNWYLAPNADAAVNAALDAFIAEPDNSPQLDELARAYAAAYRRRASRWN